MDPILRQQALDYHEFPTPGKISIQPTKQLTNQRDLALAYSPGVAAACLEIAQDPMNAFKYTARGNLVGVVTNGTAVLGLGDIGPLAAKPVMEGKGVLFKKFAGIDVFDIELAERDLDKIVDAVAALEPTFGGINLEDIKAPDCFYIERKLRERMKIPVFHDDQHGTAIVVAAALVNGLAVVGKEIGKVKLVVSGAGAAALACLDLLLDLGMPKENIWVTDIKGVVYEGRTELMDPEKARFCQPTSARQLADVIADADVFLGLSAGGVLKPEMVAKMAAKPIIFALANPEPEILPELVKEVRQDAVIATGRTDYPNQVNNVLCFPFIFRGALDVGATTITRGMELAAVRAMAELARAEQSEVVTAAYGTEGISFGPEYLIPKPFDPRLIVKIAPAVAQAAMDDGVAIRPLSDMDAYVDRLQEFVYHSGNFMKPLLTAARRVQVVLDEGLADPILIGRPAVIEKRIARFGLRMHLGEDVTVVNPEQDDRYREYWETYHQMTERSGVTSQYAQIEMRRRHTLIGAMMIHKGHADAMICGTFGTHSLHLHYVNQVIGRAADASVYAAMNILILQHRTIALVDTHVNENPSAEALAEITVVAAQTMRSLGLDPRVALLSHSNFGSGNSESARKMRDVLQLVREREPSLNVDGEMHGDVALDAELRKALMPNSTLQGDANLLVLPSMESANISYNLLKRAAGNNVAIGPILLGCAAPVHVLTASATVRRLVNMTAIAVVQANAAVSAGEGGAQG
jgi:malate dehydrogenase (oxaloacetate-decarboxylating)(NADP+)